MEHAKKYYLVEPAEYENLVRIADSKKTDKSLQEKIFINPFVKKTMNINKDLKEIINDNQLTDYDKAEIYNREMDNYMKNFKQSLTTSTKQALLGDTTKQDLIHPPVQNSPSSQVTSNNLDLIIKDIPPSYRPQAERVLKFLSSNPSFEWADNDRLLHRGKEIEGSPSQLIGDIVRQRRPVSSMSDLNQFSEILTQEGFTLNKSKIPLPNTDLRKPTKRKGEPNLAITQSDPHLPTTWESLK